MTLYYIFSVKTIILLHTSFPGYNIISICRIYIYIYIYIHIYTHHTIYSVYLLIYICYMYNMICNICCIYISTDIQCNSHPPGHCGGIAAQVGTLDAGCAAKNLGKSTQQNPGYPLVINHGS